MIEIHVWNVCAILPYEFFVSNHDYVVLVDKQFSNCIIDILLIKVSCLPFFVVFVVDGKSILSLME